MKMERFLKALKEDDFGMGDSFHLGNFEFEVIGIRGPNRVDEDGPIFRQVRPRRSFAMRVEDQHGDDGRGRLERAALTRLVADRGARYEPVADATAGGNPRPLGPSRLSAKDVKAASLTAQLVF